MKHSKFVHLHVHTDYSFLDGACRIEPLVEKAAEYKMPALAITDHGGMCGAIKFYKACVSHGIKPIIGCEFYVASASHKEKTKENLHMTLLAADQEGYVNLMKLNEIAYREGFFHKPRIDIDLIKRHSAGLVALSGCLQGKIARLILDDRKERAVEEALKYNEIFGPGKFFLEMMDSGVPQQKKVNRGLFELSHKTGIKYVATNDCHYINKDDAYAQEILMCIGTGKKIDDPGHLKFSTEEYYLKSPEEMKELFRDYPEAVENTLEVAKLCNLQISFGNNYLPEYEVPSGFTKEKYLERLCRDGIKKRYSKMKPEIKERLNTELEVINSLGFAGYFLICWDFVNFARENDIPVGPGRGSGAGSIVSYLLGITNLDPLKYGLLFERFLNPDRKTMPDLDIDFGDTGREHVINYVKDRYGRDRVGQIATFLTLKARAAVRDVGRVLDVPLSVVDKISKMIPFDTTIYRAIEDVPELKKTYNSDDRIKQMLDIARKIEGSKRQPGLHAAGVVIAKDDLSNFVPRGVSSDNREVTQYEGDDLVELGLLKMDFLGLRALTIIHKAVNNIKQRKGIDLDIETIVLDDSKTYELLQKAESIGVFQIESEGFRDLLRKLSVSVFEEIIALVALFRPGPMSSGMTDEFIERKKDAAKIRYPHKSLEEILRETYGVVLYQEQVMQVARKLGNFTPAQADDMRKAMSKKIGGKLQAMKDDFVAGAVQNGLKKNNAENIFDMLSKFGAYGFNKSHSAAYATLAYQTAYLKANYPTEYMAALLTCEMHDTDNIAKYVAECERMGIKVFNPCALRSGIEFSIEEEGAIRYGLLAIKNVGAAAIESIVETREKSGKFRTFYDFCSRVDLQKVNKRVLESLVRAGAFDFLGKGRKPLFQSIESAMSQAASYQKDVKMGQTSFFKVFDGDEVPEVEIADTREWHENEILLNEKDALGFYLSGHPLAKYSNEISTLTSGEIKALRKMVPHGSEVIIGGMVKHKKMLKTRQGDLMLVFMIEDLSDTMEAVVFPSVYSEAMGEIVKEDALLVINGKIDDNRGRKQCVVNNIIPLEEARGKLVGSVVLRINAVGTDTGEVEHIKKIIEKYPGDIAVAFEIKTKKYDIIKISTGTRVRISDSMLEELGNAIGADSISLMGKVYNYTAN
ncbi:MAG: DNA polymerase III subunit alpha [Elusimicrobiota bacterium]